MGARVCVFLHVAFRQGESLNTRTTSFVRYGIVHHCAHRLLGRVNNGLAAVFSHCSWFREAAEVFSGATWFFSCLLRPGSGREREREQKQSCVWAQSSCFSRIGAESAGRRGDVVSESRLCHARTRKKNIPLLWHYERQPAATAMYDDCSVCSLVRYGRYFRADLVLRLPSSSTTGALRKWRKNA